MTRIRLPRLWPPGKDGSHADSSDPVPLWTALAYITASAAAIWLTLPASLTSLNLGLLAFFAGLQLVLVNLPVPAAAFDSRGRGFVSLDRLSLVAAVLVLGPAPASWAAGTGILIWTLTGDPRREPWRARVTRAVANGGMFVLATVAAGTIYTKLGGHIPLTSLNLADLGRACLLILILQSVNELLFLLMSWRGMSPTDRRHPLDWRSTFSELTVGLNGIIAALAWTNLPRIGFALYVAFVIVFAFLFKYIAGIAERERERAEESAAVNRVNQAVNSAVSLDELLEIIFREASNLMQFAAFIIAVHDGERDELDVRINYDEGTRRAPTRHKQSEGLLAWTLRHNEPIFITDRRTSNHDAIRDSIIHGRNPVSIIAIPINFGDEIVGILSVQDYRPNAFKQRHLQLLENFAGQIAVAIVNTRLFAELKANQQELESRVRRRTAELELAAGSLEEAMHQKEILLARVEQESRQDVLTGLANRRRLDEALDQELRRALRFNHPVALVMGDLDHFKQINDTHGHALGDEVLYQVAEVLRQGVRATDFVARYGGEEFVILLPETNQEQAATVCEKLRELIADAPWKDLDSRLAVTMSFGVAAFAGESQTAAGLLAEADRALYAAKHGGRDRVHTALA